MQPLSKRAFFLALTLATVTTLIYCVAVDAIWFREDDLGTILNGLIHSWQDAKRVLLADCRSFIVAINYQRTMPNVISGFLRPIQNIVFTLVHAFFGTQAYAYYVTQVLTHAANAGIFLLLLARFCPLWIAGTAGFAFAFYPELGWLTWIGTLQNSLSVLFLLLAAHVWLPQLVNQECSCARQLGTGLLFLLSLLSRETAFFIPGAAAFAWFVLATPPSNGFWKRVWQSSKAIWPLLAAVFLFALLRLAAFGVGTLPRTARNLTLRYPALVKLLPLLGSTNHKEQAATPSPLAEQKQPETVAEHPVKQQATVSLATRLWSRVAAWTQAITNLPCQPQSPWCTVIVLGLVVLALLVVFSFYGNGALLLALLALTLCTLWPGILVYPAARYVNLMYPCLLALLAGAMTRLSTAKKTYQRSGAMVIGGVLVLATLHGTYTNATMLRAQGRASAAYQERFDRFFTTHQFAPDTTFVVLGSPFVSDIASIFASYLGVRQANVAHELFCTLAEQGSMGCWADYRTRGVASSIEPIAQGFRFVSHNPEHCAWWIHFSDFPIAWNATQRAYEWTAAPYQQGVWYPCSLGRFMINAVHNNYYITDLTLELDPVWTKPGTVFVGWDSLAGAYVLLN